MFVTLYIFRQIATKDLRPRAASCLLIENAKNTTQNIIGVIQPVTQPHQKAKVYSCSERPNSEVGGKAGHHTEAQNTPLQNDFGHDEVNIILHITAD